MEVEYQGRAFKSGNSVAVRLPKGLGIKAGDQIRLSQSDGGGVLLDVVGPAKAKLDVDAFWGVAPGLKLAPREDFEERPSSITKRSKAAR